MVIRDHSGELAGLDGRGLALFAGFVIAGAGVAEALRGGVAVAVSLLAVAIGLWWFAGAWRVGDRSNLAMEGTTGNSGTPGFHAPFAHAAADYAFSDHVSADHVAADYVSLHHVAAKHGAGGAAESSAPRFSGAAEVLRSLSTRDFTVQPQETRFSLVPIGLADDPGQGEFRTDFLETASRISRRLGSSHNIKRMANNFVTEVMEIFDFTACALWIFDDSKALAFVITRAPLDPSRDGIRLGDEVPPGIIADLKDFGFGGATVPDRLKIDGSVSWGTLRPLSLEGCLLGIFQAEGADSPGREGLEVLLGLLSQFSLVFFNIRLARQITLISEDISKRDFEFVTLNVFSRITNRSMDTDRIVEFTLEFVSKALDLTAVTLSVEKDGRTGISKERGQEGQLRLLRDWWRVTSENELSDGGCHCHSLSREFSARLKEIPGGVPGGAGYMSAILRGGEVMNLVFFSMAPELKPRSRKFLEMVAKQVQVAVDSSSTLANLDRKVRLLNLIYAVCGAMAEKVSFGERMGMVVDYLKVFLDVPGCGIFARKGPAGWETLRPFLSKGFAPGGEFTEIEGLSRELAESFSNAEGFVQPGGSLDGLFVSALNHGDRPAGFLVVDGGPGFSGSGTRDFEVVRAVSILVSQMVADHWMNMEVADLKELLSSVFDTVEDAIVVLDSTGMILSENRAVSRIFGSPGTIALKSEEADRVGNFRDVPPRQIRELLAEFPLALGLVEEALRRLGSEEENPEIIHPGGAAGSGNSIHSAENSGLRAMEFFAAPMGRDRLVVTVRDMTERWRMQAELKRVERLAALGEMAAGMAHEIRNPLGGIKVLASFLASSLSGEPGKKEMADTILTGVAEVDSRIGALLGYARPERPEVSSQDLNALVASGIEIYMAEAASHGIEVDLTGLCPPGAMRVLTDPSKFGQILGNVLRNAIQAQPEGGSIRVWAAPRGEDFRSCPGKGPADSRDTFLNGRKDMATVVVDDDGSGMDGETLVRMYDPFFTTKPDGTGLGMAISQKIILALGGDIRTESSPERGTRVTIFLPIDPSPEISGMMFQPDGGNQIQEC